ncbi:MAG: ABC transporter permease [Blastocatellia bacterium]
MIKTVSQDLRYGIRTLAQRPGFAAAAALALALGIGANSAIFSVVNAVLLRSLPYEAPDQLVIVQSTRRQDPRRSGSASYPDFADFRSQNQVFDDMAAFRSRGYTLTGAGEPERIDGARVSASFFQLLGAEPHLGRAFLPEEDKPEAARVVIISHGLWQRRFGGDPDVIGRTLTLDGNSYTVVGVATAGFSFPIEMEKADIWSPLALDGELLEQRGAHFLRVIARLKPGVPLQAAQAEMSTIATRLEQQYPEDDTDRVVALYSLYDHLVGGIRPALLVLLAVVGFVLLIACSNVANLLLARAATRQREIAIRMALGASRGRIIRQLITESLILAFIGGGAGLLLALWGVESLVALSPANLPRMSGVGVDRWVLGFTLIVSVMTGIIFGLAPAIKASKPDLNDALKEGGRGSTEGFSGRRLRNLLVVSEMALALVVLISAGLLIRSFLRLQQVNAGFDPSNILTMQVELPSSKYKEGVQVSAFFEQVLERINALPGVESAGAVTTLPLSGSNMRTSFTVQNRPAPPPGQEPLAHLRAVTPGYFRTLRIPLLKGQEFGENYRKSSPGRIIINDTMARRFWPDEDPIGQRISIGMSTDEDEPALWEIVGIVGDVRHASLDAEPAPEMYVPHSQQSWPFLTLVIRTTSDPMAMAGAARAQVLAVDKDQPVSSVKSMEGMVSASIAQPRFYLLLLGIFAALALTLAAVGVYGVLSYSVTQRMHEIGIRMALGAKPFDVIRLVVGQGLVLSLAGVAVGLVGAYVFTRLMSSMLYGVSATDPVTFAALAVLLMAVALLASYVPARRATKVDPMVALRYE